MSDKWNRRFLSLAQHVASFSKDPSTKTGAVIVAPNNMIISLGYNGFPRGVEDSPDHYNNRDVKYERIIHSEVNAILAARTDLTGCALYCYPLLPCSRCATVIIQAGITMVVFPYMEDNEVINRFKNSHEHSVDMMQQAGVKLLCYDEVLT